jgi:hypothetical protein
MPTRENPTSELKIGTIADEKKKAGATAPAFLKNAFGLTACF